MLLTSLLPLLLAIVTFQKATSATTVSQSQAQTTTTNAQPTTASSNPPNKPTSFDAFSVTSTSSSLPSTHAINNAHNDTAERPMEYPPFDGWYNNYAHPEWGAADTALLRLLPPAYGDGSYAPSGANRANPLEVARAVFDGPTGRPSYRNRTALLVFFGQQMVEEILDAQGSGCPPEYFNIPIPKGHPLFDPAGHGGREIPLLRTRYDARTGHSPNVPREQLNEVTPYFDGNLMYGPNKAWCDSLRLFKDGLLAATNDSTDPSSIDRDRYFPALNDIRLPYANPPPPRDHVLKPVRRFYKIGNPRGNENPFLLTFGILWFRYHNFRARQLKHNHPDWDDEKLFNEARKWVIAVHQKIVYFDWLPAWLGETLEPYKGYNPHIHPQITHVFQSAAMRFGHTLVPPGVYRRDASCNFRKTTRQTKFEGHIGLRTCNSFWNPQEAIRESDIDEFLMGMASQIAEREDHIVTPDLHGHVFGTLDFSRRDLMAVNIQRGRDHGLPDYNTAREFFNLPRIKDISELFENFTGDRAELLRLFPTMDDVDIWPGGMLETSEQGPGPLFRAIIKNQFLRIRDGDRFFFENYNQNNLYTAKDIAEIRNVTIKDIILAVTNISKYDIQDNPFFHHADAPCHQPKQLNPLDGDMEDCTPVQSFDYFSGSEAPYIVTLIFILGSIAPLIGILICAALWHKKSLKDERAKLHISRKKTIRVDNTVRSVTAIEWMGHKQGSRAVKMTLDETKRRFTLTENDRIVRTIDLSRIDTSQRVRIVSSMDVNMRMTLVQIPKDYDLVLVFENDVERDQFRDKLRNFLQAVGINFSDTETQPEQMIKQHAVTKQKRQKVLDKFFSAIFAQALKYDEGYARQSVNSRDASLYVSCELTKAEFADALGLEIDSMFVTNMFQIVDKNENGFISFREFLDFFVIFSKGTADDKAKLLFSMHDLDGNGTLTKDSFKMMLRSMVELGNEKVEEDKIDDLVNSLFHRAGLDKKQHITVDDFQQMLRDYKDDLNVMSLDMQFGATKVQAAGKRENAAARARRTLLLDPVPAANGSAAANKRYTQFAEVRVIEPTMPGEFQWILRFFENYRRQIFWVSLYTLAMFGIFIERAYYYAIEREASGLRRICGYGVAITRGAASAMMFTYATMLVTMCRNMITYLRDTFLHIYVPFDDAVNMHKYVGFWSAVFTFVHIIGHCFNIYHISSQTPMDLACLFRNYFHPTDALPKFTKWCWTTITGLTGMALTVQFFMLLIFSVAYARQHTFKAFWAIHLTYPVYFILMILHGAGRMIQAPYTYYFVLGPIILFTVDQLISVSRRKVEITVLKAKLLPSDVTYLEMKRPTNFQYKSGQWVRIACLDRGKNEYHPFTLTSAPHEENLMLHVRAVGPWTYAIRRLYDPRLVQNNKLPKVFIDGPYGEGHQDWHRFDVSILIGGGIGITPFASILKDIAEKSRNGTKINCKKIYFVWVTRTQRHFEWMSDIIRQLEEKDSKNLVTCHIFITEFKERFDIRTTMLYICEKYFQKISDRSLFTGLHSATHFGRPDFSQFFHMVKAAHPDTSVFGVFSCGPPPLTQSVDKACAHDNKYTDNVLFVHHHENI